MKLKALKGFISVVLVSLALFGNTQPPADAGNIFEKWIMGIVVRMVSCDGKPASDGTSNNNLPATNSSSNVDGIDVNNRDQIEDTIKNQTVNNSQNASNYLKDISPRAHAVLTMMYDGDRAKLKGDVVEAIKYYDTGLKMVPGNDSETARTQNSLLYDRRGCAYIQLGSGSNMKESDRVKYFTQGIADLEKASEFECHTDYLGASRKANLLADAAALTHSATLGANILPGKDCALLTKAKLIAPAGSGAYARVIQVQGTIGCK